MNTPTFIKRLKYRSARKKLIPYIKTENPIINGLVDLVLKYNYDYDTVYAVYTEWDNDIITTESTLISALFMSVDPLSITQDSMRQLEEVIRMSMITIGDD